jgi:peptide/nickel transport system permease protein
MSTERGRIQITGFDPDRVENRASLSDWGDETETESSSRWQRALAKFRRNRSAMFGLGVVTVLTILSILARPITISVLGDSLTVQPMSLAPYDPSVKLQVLPGLDHDVERYAPPSINHPMGIDGQGRDIFSRFLAGGRYSMSIGFVVVLVTSTVGVIYGGISGYFGGLVDEVLMRILDVIYAFPGIVVALVLVTVLGSGYWTLVLAFSLFGWSGYARLVRGEILSVKENEYVLAAKALGGRDTRILFKHVIPNAIAPVIVQASLAIGTTVIGVAALGFLGLGFQPGTPEWGTMLNNARETISPGPGEPIKWWVTFFPGAAIFIFVMSMNMIGDGINDALDAQQDITGGDT